MDLIILKNVHFLAAGSVDVDHNLVLEVLPTINRRILLGVHTNIHILVIRSKSLRYDVARFISAQEEVALHRAFCPQSCMPHERIAQELFGRESPYWINHEHFHKECFGVYRDGSFIRWETVVTFRYLFVEILGVSSLKRELSAQHRVK